MVHSTDLRAHVESGCTAHAVDCIELTGDPSNKWLRVLWEACDAVPAIGLYGETGPDESSLERMDVSYDVEYSGHEGSVECIVLCSNDVYYVYSRNI